MYSSRYFSSSYWSRRYFGEGGNAAPSSAFDGFRIEVQLSPGAWTDVSADVSTVEPPSGSRGMSGGGPLDLVAARGVLTFMLNNHASNSGATLGWYSPASTSCRSGWELGIPVRALWTFLATDYVLWTGKLRDIDPLPGELGDRKVLCTAYDCMADLIENDCSAIPPQVGQTENALIQAVIDAMPAAAQPVAVSCDPSLDTYTYALDNAPSGTKGISLIAGVAVSARAYVYPLADGTLRVENRQARSALTSTFDFDDESLLDVEVPTSLSDVFNHVRATEHPRTVPPGTIVLFGITGLQAVEPGQTVEIWGDYNDPTNPDRLIGGTDQITALVSGTDYAANDAADGSGADVTADISVVVSAFAARVKFAVTNTGGTTAYLVDAGGDYLLQLRGKGVYDNAPVSFEAVSVESYGDRLLLLDLIYQDNGPVAASLAEFVRAQYASRVNRARALTFETCTDESFLLQALIGEIGDVGVVSELVTGLDEAPVAIQGIEWTYIPGSTPGLRMRYILAPRLVGASFVLDDAVLGVLDGTEGVLGYA